MNMHSNIASANTVGNLAEHAVLANLRIRQWTARRFDRAQSDEVNDRAGAKSDVARVNKRLIAKTALAEIQAIVSSARADHDRLTSPWGVRGLNILAVVGYLNYREVMNRHGAAFDTAKRNLIAAYPAEREAAIAALGAMFNPDDYPATIDDRFHFSVHFLPVPQSGDFRVGLHDAELDEIRRDIEESTRAATNKAIMSIYERADIVLTALVDKLGAYQPAQGDERAKGIFRDSLVGNIRDLAATMPLLNVFGDPAIAELAAKLEKLGDHEAKDLRDSDAMRAHLADEAKTTLDEIRNATASYL